MMNELLDLLRQNVQEIKTLLPCEVVKVHTDSVQVDIKILTKHLTHDTELDYPIIKNCPTLTIGGQNMLITAPLKVGDYGLALFATDDIEPFYYDSKTQQYSISNINNCIYIGAIHKVKDNPKNYDYNNYLTLRDHQGETYIKLATDQCNIKIKQTNRQGNITNNGTINTTGDINHNGNCSRVGNLDNNGKITAPNGQIETLTSTTATITTLTATTANIATLSVGALSTPSVPNVDQVVSQGQKDIEQLKIRVAKLESRIG